VDKRDKNKKTNAPISIRKKQVNSSKRTNNNFRNAPFETVRLADSIKQLMQQRIQPARRVCVDVTGCWNNLLPDGLRKHCRIVQISKGNLKVQADSPSYLYELKLSGSEILEHMQSCCPRARIKKIDFVVC